MIHLLYSIAIPAAKNLKAKQWTWGSMINVKARKLDYLVTAPIERPHKPIKETLPSVRRYSTTALRSSFWERGKKCRKTLLVEGTAAGSCLQQEVTKQSIPIEVKDSDTNHGSELTYPTSPHPKKRNLLQSQPTHPAWGVRRKEVRACRENILHLLLLITGSRGGKEGSIWKNNNSYDKYGPFC